MDAVHVEQVGMAQADDRAIWQFASDEKRALISKDDDFLHHAIRPGSTCLFIWVRLGNCRKAALLDAFERVLPQILEAGATSQRVVEIR